jgi:hypothetical protein
MADHGRGQVPLARVLSYRPKMSISAASQSTEADATATITASHVQR